MQADHFKRLQTIFDAALEQNAEMRTEYISQACGEDKAMAEEVMALIEYEARAAAAKTAQPFALAAAALDAVEAKALIGSTIGRFQVEEEIASGGMGRVFKAKRVDGEVDQTVALKLIRRELFNPALLKRFSEERKILASLNHPGIAHLIDAGADEQGAPFVAMEYVDGLSLLEYCAQKGLSIRDRIELFRQILAAVSYAHRNLVVHRDLKPANVLVTANGQVKLLDFGIAKALEAEHLQTATVDHFFTPAYAAPEQLLKQNVTVACDVYALGAILYTLLTGVPPFDAAESSASEIERQILKVPPSPMRAAVMKRGQHLLKAQGVANLVRWAKQFDGDLDSIVQKALRKEPGARYTSVELLDQDLVRYLGRRPVRASATGWSYRARKFIERNAVMVGLGLVVAVASLVGIGYILKQNSDIRSERDRSQAALNILKNAIAVASPEQRSGGNYSQVVSILAAAAKEVRALEKSKPELFQDLAYQIAEIQIGIGSGDEGLAMVQRANRAGQDIPKRGVLLEINALTNTEDSDRVREARKLLESNRKAMSEDLDFLVMEAILLSYEKRNPEAIALSERLLLDQSILNSDWSRGQLFFALARSYKASGDIKNTLITLDKIIADRSRIYGEGHTRTLVARMQRVSILLNQNKDDDAAQRELIAMKSLVEGSRDYASGIPAAYHNIFSVILFNQNKIDEALAQMQKALTAAEIGDGIDGWEASMVRVNIARTIVKSNGDRREAYAYYERAIAGIEKTKGASSPVAGDLRRKVAFLRLEDGDIQLARDILTPPSALEYFPKLSEFGEKLQPLYLSALHRSFGPQSCAPGWENKTNSELEQKRIARTLLCRYDPKGEYRNAE